MKQRQVSRFDRDRTAAHCGTIVPRSERQPTAAIDYVPISRIDGGYCEANERVDLRRGKVVWVRPEDIEVNELGGATRPLAEEFRPEKNLAVGARAMAKAAFTSLRRWLDAR